MAHLDTASTSNQINYFQNLTKKGANTIKVKALEDTTASFIVVSLAAGGRGTHSYIYKNLTVNGSDEKVTYTKGSPSFNGNETPSDWAMGNIVDFDLIRQTTA